MNTQDRLQLAADRTEIVDLIARVSRLADSGTLEDYIACFTDDAIWELTQAQGLPMEPQIIRGHAAILEGVRERRASGIQGPGSHTVHAVQRTSVEVNGDAASAESIFIYYTETNATPVAAALGQYSDTLARVDGRWLVGRRTIRRD